MKWVTRERAKVDRIACPWLIRRFVDPQAEFLYVAADAVMDVAAREGAVPFDVPGVELGHHGPLCSFDAILDKHGLDDPALRELAKIVRGADTSDSGLTEQSLGLRAIATGFSRLFPDDRENLGHQSFVYDALYEYCRGVIGR
jgi:hypothetical protein